jgi:hypothetical protein
MSCIQSVLLWLFKNTCISSRHLFRDRPFNLQRGGEGGGGGGGVMVFCFVQNFFFRATRELEYFFLSKNLTLGYMTKTLNQIFFSSTKIRIFFSATLGIRIFFFRKKP